MAGILISFLYLCLHIAVIIFIAYVIWWVITGLFKITPDPNVFKFGQIIVVLLCIIAVVDWMFGLNLISSYGGYRGILR